MLEHSLKVPAWRRIRQISGHAWARMVEEGTAPKLLVLGPRTRLVTPEADSEWLATNTHEAALASAEVREHGRRMNAARRTAPRISEAESTN